MVSFESVTCLMIMLTMDDDMRIGQFLIVKKMYMWDPPIHLMIFCLCRWWCECWFFWDGCKNAVKKSSSHHRNIKIYDNDNTHLNYLVSSWVSIVDSFFYSFLFCICVESGTKKVINSFDFIFKQCSFPVSTFLSSCDLLNKVYFLCFVG